MLPTWCLSSPDHSLSLATVLNGSGWLIWRSGLYTRLPCKRSRVRSPYNTKICIHEHVHIEFLCLYKNHPEMKWKKIYYQLLTKQNLTYYNFEEKKRTIIIISPSQATDRHRPLQLLAISLDLRLLASSSRQPSCANRHSIWPEGVLHDVYREAVSTPELVYKYKVSV
jgi:hypothetical protein